MLTSFPLSDILKIQGYRKLDLCYLSFVHEYNQVGQESWETIIVLEVMGKFLEQSSYS